MGLTEDFAELFSGNPTAYGTDAGGCVRGDVPWKDHLNGDRPIGVYPLKVYDPTSPGPLANCWVCKFGVVDFDVKSNSHPSFDYETETEAHEAAVNLQAVLAELGVAAWIERTRSCGRHLWLMSRDWVSARTMRRALLAASEIADTSSREINPKQESLKDEQLGNYVRCMYPGALTRLDVASGANGRRGVLLYRGGSRQQESPSPSPTSHDGFRRSCASDAGGRDRAGRICLGQQDWEEANLCVECGRSTGRCGSYDDFVSANGQPSTGQDSRMPRRVAITPSERPYCAECFVVGALSGRTRAESLRSIASLWRPPTQSKPPLCGGQWSYEGTALNPKGIHIWENGPLDGDRSRGMSYLARQCFESGLERDVALMVLGSCEWNKFTGRGDEAKRLQELVDGAYG